MEWLNVKDIGEMDIKYFQDTDRLLVSFSDGGIVETRDVNENFLIELDADGKVVSVTIEHAGERVDVSRFVLSGDQSDGGSCFRGGMGA